MNQKEFEQIYMYIAFSLFLTFFIIYVSSQVYDTFNKRPEQVINFNVTGIINATNSSIVSLQFECIKFCGTELSYSSNDKVDKCWQKCSELGK